MRTGTGLVANRIAKRTMSEPLTSHDEPKQTFTAEDEAFYRKVLATQYWGSAEPNGFDECRRWEVIEQLLREFVLPGRTAAGPLKILDLGCGRGWLTKELARFGEPLGIDPLDASI